MQKSIILFFVFVILSGIVMGQVPQLINYQALLMDPATGQPVPDNTYSITFSIYDVASSGSAIWSEPHSVDTKIGLYSVMLGSITPLTSAILSGPEKYLGIKVGEDPEMSPRKRIVSVAYAILSEDADKLDGKHADAFADSVHSHDDRYYTETELNTSDGDPPNQGSNRMSWDNLKDMPPGFADGVDNVNGGGGNTLDQAYDQGGAGVGRSITADAGEVRIGGPDGLIVEGNVGIGIESATDKLHVGGNIKTEGTLFVPNGAGFFRGLELSEDAMVAGKVGIGNMSPTSTLDIKLSGDVDALTVHASTGLGRADLYQQGADNSIAFELDDPTSGASKVFLSPTVNSFFNGGNVGIGTTNPDEQLEITGNFRLPTTTATTGIIKSGEDRFIHNHGSDNFFAGVNAGNLSMSGIANTGIGVNALLANTTGQANTAIGLWALEDNTEGEYNTATGFLALNSNTTGYRNVADGDRALSVNTSGSFNTASGSLALENNKSGSYNTAIGAGTLSQNNTGTYNTAMGLNALYHNTTGTYNTAIGYWADVTSENLSNATAIGYNAKVDASNKVRIGDDNVSVIAGKVDFTVDSDSTKKENFLPVDGEHSLEKIRQFKLGSWNFKGQDPLKFRHYGPMAQEFFTAFGNDGMGTVGTDTTICGSDINGINMIAIQALEKRTQQQQKIIEQQHKQLAATRTELQELNLKMARFESAFQSLKAFLAEQDNSDKKLLVRMQH